MAQRLTAMRNVTRPIYVTTIMVDVRSEFSKKKENYDKTFFMIHSQHDTLLFYFIFTAPADHITMKLFANVPTIWTWSRT
jgi:hypothetical protein